jgi:hypothetical protein
MRHFSFSAVLCAALFALSPACGGNVVVDGSGGTTPGGNSGTTQGSSSSGTTFVTDTPTTVEPTCFALCNVSGYKCNGASGTGTLTDPAAAPEGCTWTFTTPGSTEILTMDCSLNQQCMYENGVCGALNWAAPGDTGVPPLGFGTSSDLWSCYP